MTDDEELGIISDSEDGRDPAGSSALMAQFGAASDWVAGAVSSGQAPANVFTDAVKLQLYGLYKQATSGVCSAPQPAFWNRAARLKWDAWHKLGTTTSMEAMQRYCELLMQLTPQWATQQATTTGSGNGGCAAQPGGGVGGAQQPLASGRAGGGDTAGGRGFGPIFSVMAEEEGGPEGTGGRRGASGAGGPDMTKDEEEEAAARVHELAGQGDLAGVLALLDKGVPVDARNGEGCTPLHFAADRGQAEVAQALLRAGADANAVDEDGATPLHYAALCSNLPLVEVLLGAGADPRLEDSSGNTAKAVGPPAWTCWG